MTENESCPNCNKDNNGDHSSLCPRKSGFLYKYSLDEKKSIEPGTIGGKIIKYKIRKQGKNGNKEELTNGTFLTPNTFDLKQPELAQTYLAITYTPKFENTFALNQGRVDLKNTDGELICTRIWPAFGYPGGAYEIILAQGTLKNVSLKLFPNGGKPDKYHFDGAKSGSLYTLLAHLVQGRIAFHLRREENNAEIVVIVAKVYDDAGTVISWAGKKDLRYSISCGYNKNNGMVKFWGNLWKDIDEKIRIVYYADPLVTYIGDIESFICGNPCSHLLVEKMLDEMYESLKNMAQSAVFKPHLYYRCCFPNQFGQLHHHWLSLHSESQYIESI